MRNECIISIDGAVEYSLNVKRSKFLGHAEPVFNVDTARRVIKNISRSHRSATHNCWAYKIGEETGFSDSGEPSGTAGRPILNAIEKMRLNGVVVIVTRYFGGIKLGKRGLIEAYFTTALRTLEKAKKIEYHPFLIVEIRMNYDVYDRFMRYISNMKVKFDEGGFSYCEDGLMGRMKILKNDYEGMKEYFGDSVEMKVMNATFETFDS